MPLLAAAPNPPIEPAWALAAMLGGAAAVAIAIVLKRHGGRWLLAIAMRFAPFALGVRRCRIGGWPCLVAEPRGAIDAPPLVVLHGLGVRKETMLALLSGLRVGRRAIAPDLPGFGEHRLSPDLAAALTRESFAHGMRPTFAEAMGRRCGPETDAYLDAIAAWLERAIEGPFDLLGASMGGALAASLAARMPDRVERLVLLGPAGVRAPRLNEFMREVEADRNPLEIRTVEDLDRVTRLNFVTPPHIPRAIRAALAEDLRARQPTQDLVIDALGPLLLDGLRETLPQVEAKTLVLWGERDEILDASASEVFATTMRRATVEEVPNAGHTLHGDRPKEVIPRVRAFLER
ncbi:MAG: alpha/beta fold hydrolase [Phycisphaerales bacterium]